MDEFRVEVDALVRAASSGETVLILDGDSVVAELVPPRQPYGSASDWVAVGMREGWLTPAEERGPPPSRPIVGDKTFEQMLNDLARDRADR